MMFLGFKASSHSYIVPCLKLSEITTKLYEVERLCDATPHTIQLGLAGHLFDTKSGLVLAIVVQSELVGHGLDTNWRSGWKVNSRTNYSCQISSETRNKHTLPTKICAMNYM